MWFTSTGNKQKVLSLFSCLIHIAMTPRCHIGIYIVMLFTLTGNQQQVFYLYSCLIHIAMTHCCPFLIKYRCDSYQQEISKKFCRYLDVWFKLPRPLVNTLVFKFWCNSLRWKIIKKSSSYLVIYCLIHIGMLTLQYWKKITKSYFSFWAG